MVFHDQVCVRARSVLKKTKNKRKKNTKHENNKHESQTKTDKHGKKKTQEKPTSERTRKAQTSGTRYWHTGLTYQVLVCLEQNMHFFVLACCSSVAESFTRAFGRGASKPHMGTPRRTWRCSEHPTSLSWLFSSRGCVPPRCPSRAGAWKNRRRKKKSLISSRIFVFASLSRPPYIIS